MQQQILRMKTFFNTSLTELQKDLTKTKSILSNVGGETQQPSVGAFYYPPSPFFLFFSTPKSAFSVAQCFGSFRDNKLIT